LFWYVSFLSFCSLMVKILWVAVRAQSGSMV
jgi:hypothetical protein